MKVLVAVCLDHWRTGSTDRGDCEMLGILNG